MGCGSGIVTTELAKCFPSAEIVGVDLAAVSRSSSTPENITFLQGDFFRLADNGTLKEEEFDFIFSRLLVAGMVEWQSYACTVKRLLKHGGWAEMQDLSWHLYDREGCSIDDTSPFVLAIQRLSLKKGLDPFCGERLAEYLRSAGLQAVGELNYPWTWTTWSSRPEADLLAAHERSEQQVAVREFLLDKLNEENSIYTSEEMEFLKEDNRLSIERTKEGVHCLFGIAYGQK